MTTMMDRKRSKGKQVYRGLLLLFGIGLLASVLLVTVWTWQAGSDAVRQGLQAAKPWLLAWRLLLFAVLIGGWPYWVGCLARRGRLDERLYRHALSQRWRVAAWLLVIEILLVQGIAAQCFAGFMELR